jgi:hypothetical protein
MQVAQYERDESSLDLFYRLDTLYEKQMESDGEARKV